MSADEINAKVGEYFRFDGFRWQQENKVVIDTPDPAEGLNRILYKCPHCGAEGKTEGKGIHLTCHSCGKVWQLLPNGQMQATEGETEIPHIPDWYRWERQQVRQEILDGTYKLDTDVDIAMQVDYKAIYKVGSGHLTHDASGFHLTGCDGKLDYSQKPQSSYTLYADYYWYEIADVIGIGDNEFSYFCFPKGNVSVTKARLATEELYKIAKNASKQK